MQRVAEAVCNIILGSVNMGERSHRVYGGAVMRRLIAGATLAFLAAGAWAQALPAYDLLLRGGHVIDTKNHIDAIMDVATKDGHIARVGPGLNSGDAIKTIDARGLYVTPGLIDLHVHVYNGTGERRSYAGDLSVPPDGFTFRSGVTTVIDAGCSGWRNFEDFKDRIVDRAKTRILVSEYAAFRAWCEEVDVAMGQRATVSVK